MTAAADSPVPGRRRGGRSALWLLAMLVAALLILRMGRGAAPVPPVFAAGAGATLAEAQERSADTGRPVLVLATADWCGPCQSLKRGALTDPAVESLIRDRTIPFYLDVTSGASAEASRLGVKGIPALILLDGGREVSRLVGSASAAEVSKFIEGRVPAPPTRVD